MLRFWGTFWKKLRKSKNLKNDFLMTLDCPEHKFHKMKFSNLFSLLALFEKKLCETPKKKRFLTVLECPEPKFYKLKKYIWALFRIF